MNLNFDNYSRFFAFGCSFTKYGWPTWADLIALQNPHLKYSNLGMPGSGNIAISVRLQEANKRFNFNKNDLVMVLWSTYCRESHWVDGRWLNRGNVYNSYPDNFIKEYADPIGYLIRDHALISLTNDFFENQDCNFISMYSCPFNYTEHNKLDLDSEKIIQSLQELYHKTCNDSKINLYEVMNSNWLLCKQSIYEDINDIEHRIHREDFHPFSSIYAKFLEKHGIELNPKILESTKDWDNFFTNNVTRSEMIKKFQFMTDRYSLELMTMF